VTNRIPILFAAAAVLAAAALPCAAAPSAGSQFGRFGRINDDGLLTLNVTPAGFETPPNNRYGTLKVAFGAADARVDARVTRIDPTEKRIALSRGFAGSPTALRYTLLYPGFAATFGTKMVLRVSGESNRGVTARTTAAGRRVELSAPNCPPVTILLPRPAKVTFQNGVLTATAAAPLGEVRFLTPAGITTDAAKLADLPLPTRTSSTAALSADGKAITVTETFTGGIAPLPPVLAFAIGHGYPARVRGTVVNTGVVTKWGPYTYVKGNRLTYTLPVPPTEERAYVRPANAPAKYVTLANDLVGHLGGEWAKNGVDLGYAGMANAQMAWPYLTAANKAAVSDAWKRYLPKAFVVPGTAWKTETEPFTGQPYLWTYMIDGPGGYRYDLEWGNALPLYGLYKYAQYTGDWKLVRDNWATVQRIDRYMALGDDWAWMTVVNGDHGFSTGTGDPLDAAYCGAVACLKMARALGDRAAERKYALRAARIAVPAVARFWYTDYGRRYGMLSPKGCALGFQEKEGYTRSDYGQSPWWPTTLLSADGVLPEMFALFDAVGKGAVRESEARYAAAYPQWYVGDYKYPFAASYNGNGVYVTFPHIYARAAVLNEPTPIVLKYIDAAQSNRDNAWIGPNVVAEVLSRAPGGTEPLLALAEWRPAAYLDGCATADGRKATLTFRLATPASWGLTARPAPSRRPTAVTVNGRAVPFRWSGGVLTVPPSRRPAGRLTVVVRM
jgi:hypothetical protein